MKQIWWERTWLGLTVIFGSIIVVIATATCCSFYAYDGVELGNKLMMGLVDMAVYGALFYLVSREWLKKRDMRIERSGIDASDYKRD